VIRVKEREVEVEIKGKGRKIEKEGSREAGRRFLGKVQKRHV
jgi:hypothetical protein